VKRRRALVAVALVVLAVPLAIQASCVAAFGVDVEHLRNAVADMCACPQLTEHELKEACEKTLSGRLAVAGEAARTAWLEKYDRECTSCDGVLPCLTMVPTCSLDDCKLDAECCPVSDSGKTTCDHEHCVHN
jgi:hypothetical protein